MTFSGKAAAAVRIQRLHDWDLTPAQAIALQKELAGRVESRTPLTRCRLIAGADVSYTRFGRSFFGGVVVLRAEDLSIVEQQSAQRDSAFPYVPGLLSFREAPVLLDAFRKLSVRPDVVLLDGQGVAHPRRCGLAAHLGLWLDLPTIGCAKTLFVGKHGELGPAPAAVAQLRDGEEVVGMAVRTRLRTRPVYVSVGHRIDLASAVRVVLETCRGYRLPEPTRQAHLLVNAVRRSSSA
jgi:deoxyribonuclease V